MFDFGRADDPGSPPNRSIDLSVLTNSLIVNTEGRLRTLRVSSCDERYESLRIIAFDVKLEEVRCVRKVSPHEGMMDIPFRTPKSRHATFRNPKIIRVAFDQPSASILVSRSTGDPIFPVARVQNEQRVRVPTMEVVEALVRLHQQTGSGANHIRETDCSREILNRVFASVDPVRDLHGKNLLRPVQRGKAAKQQELVEAYSPAPVEADLEDRVWPFRTRARYEPLIGRSI